jgi:hypothetical protein
MRSRFLAAAVCAALIAFATTVRADELGELEKGRAAYFAQNYDDADARFRAMLDPQTGTVHDPALVTEAHMYWGATLLALNRADDATAEFEKLLLLTPDYDPDVTRLKPNVVYFFIDVRTKMRDRLNAEKAKKLREEIERKKREDAEKARQAKRLALLESLAGQESVVLKSSRLFALLPFGAGQFQNGDNALGWFFLGTETAAALTATIAFVAYRIDLQNAANVSPAGNESNRVPFEGYISRANAARDVNLIAWGAFATAALAGVVQAQVKFVPERVEVHQRPIPNVAHVEPVIGAGFAGIQGSF